MKKSLGQHFLKSHKVIEAIMAQKPDSAKTILEVGPGGGALTAELIQFKLPFLAVEKDQSLQLSLEQLLAPAFCHLLMEDALKVDLPSALTNHHLEIDQVWLVSNLPYNISVPLFRRFLDFTGAQELTLMFQREVGIKFLGMGEEGDNNSLSMLGQNYFEVKKVINARAKDFSPPPKVESIVLHFTRKGKPPIPMSQLEPFENFLRKLFALRRKNLMNVLAHSYPTLGKTMLQQVLQKVEINPKERAQNLSHQQVENLFRKIELKNENHRKK